MSDTSTITAPSVLFTDENAGDVVLGALKDWGSLRTIMDALQAVPPGVRTVAMQRLGGVVAEAIDVDVLGALRSGWQRYQSLTSAADRTLAAPGSEEIVELATHRVTSTHEPSVEVFFDGEPLFTISFRLDLTFELRAVEGVVRGGRLVELGSGKVHLQVDLTCEDVPVRSVMRTFDLKVAMPLGSGIPLVHQAEPIVIPEAPRVT
jgi:hypothetical protein